MRTLLFVCLFAITINVGAQNTTPLPAGNTTVGGFLTVGASNEIWTSSQSLYFNYRGTAEATYFWNTGGQSGNSIMTLLNNGNVGIGYTLPRARLDLGPRVGAGKGLRVGDYLEINEREDVNNAAFIGFNTLLDEGDISKFKPIYSGAATAKGMMMMMESGGSCNLDFYGINWGTNASPRSLSEFTHVMRLSANGFVGIGTTQPEYRLDIQGGNDQLRLLNTTEGQDRDRLNVKLLDNLLTFNTDGVTSAPNILFQGYKTDMLYLTPSGVGIATRNPQANLQIGESTGEGLISVGGYSFLGCIRSSGDIFMGSNVYAKYNSSSENGVVRVKSATPSGFSMIQSGGDGKITFYGKAGQVNADEQANSLNNLGLFVDGSKGVGIGTSDIGKYRLAVEGSIVAREVVVTAASPWPDYVFAPEYKLRTLDEIEQFVKDKQHLPDVPSAEAVAKDGVNLGEMNAILLRKVEELTLLLIVQQKQMQEANSAMQKEIELLKECISLK